MSAAYKHSEVVAKLKGTNEVIKDNLTTYQYLSTLDDMLYAALQELIYGTKFIDSFLAQTLAWQTCNPKRKVTGVGREAFSSYATVFFLLDDPDQKTKVLRKMKLDRAVLFEAVRRWLTAAEEIKTISLSKPCPESFESLHNLRLYCNVREGFHVLALYRTVEYWYLKASEFKEQILQKYTRLIINTAQRDYVQLKHRVELNDIVQAYMLTASKAIDKCDSERGVVTTHIQNWLLSAKNEVVSANLDVRLNRVQAGKKIVESFTENVPLEEIEELSIDTEDEEEREHTIQEVREIAQHFDPTGIGRILLHIEEVLSPEDIEILKAHAL